MNNFIILGVYFKVSHFKISCDLFKIVFPQPVYVFKKIPFANFIRFFAKINDPKIAKKQKQGKSFHPFYCQKVRSSDAYFLGFISGYIVPRSFVSK